MTEQSINEIIKALAYGGTVEQIAAAEDISTAYVQRIAIERINEIQAEKDLLQHAGYIS